MRRWLGAATSAAAVVAERPALWLPGALAWSVGVGWIALVAGVVRPPTVAELTFFGAGIATSGLWPWNLIVGVLVLLVLVASVFALASLAESALVRDGRMTVGDVGRIFVVSLACALPATLVLVAAGMLLPFVAQAEFNAPDGATDPLARTLVRLAPLLGALLVAAAAGAAVHAAAVRAVIAGRSPGDALRSAPARLVRIGPGAVVHPTLVVAFRIGYLVIAAVLLRVLWDPIGVRLGGGGTGLADGLLLVGFVAIWLCLVLAGGALHAWGSVAWTALLAVGEGGAAADPQHLERRPRS